MIISQRNLFIVALLAWRGTLTTAPLVFTKLLPDAQFNSFAAIFGMLTLLAGVIGFGQPQYAYTGTIGNAVGCQKDDININTMAVVFCAAIIAFVAIGFTPHSPWVDNIFYRVAMLLGAAGLFIVDLTVSRNIVAGQLLSATRVYCIATPCLLAIVLPVFIFKNSLWLLLLAAPSAIVVIFFLSRVQLSDLSFSEMVDRFRFGGYQTLILLFSASMPVIIHIALPAFDLDLKGSKYVSVFTSIVGITLFFVTSSLVARSKEIAAQSSIVAQVELNRFILKVAVLSLPSMGLAILVEKIMLGTVSLVFGLCFWLYFVSQLVIIYSRYICFANRAVTVDLLANITPLILTIGFFFAIIHFELFSFRVDALVLIMTMMASLSAVIYFSSIRFGYVFQGRHNCQTIG